MAFIYLLMAILQGLMHLLYWGLVFGVPLFLARKLLQNRRNPARLALWAALAVLWVLPMGVEYARDKFLAQWVAALPAAPVIMLPAGAILALDDGIVNPKTGRAQFVPCQNREYETPHCDFSLGAELVVQGQQLALTGTGARPLAWQSAEDCDLYAHDNTLPDHLNAYLIAQGICLRPAPPAPDTLRITLTYHSAPIPGFLGQTYGQIIATANAETTTLTTFALERPRFPALWGVHWLPLLANLVPDPTTELRYGKTFDQTAMISQPAGSLQALVYAQGWNSGPAFEPDLWQGLAARFPFDADRALPALRSDGFFPTRYAIELVCAPQFRTAVTPAVVAELRRIATQSTAISNDYPRELAQRALTEGCGKGL